MRSVTKSVQTCEETNVIVSDIGNKFTIFQCK